MIPINMYVQFAGKIESLRRRYMGVTVEIAMHRLQPEGEALDPEIGMFVYIFESLPMIGS